jgi:carbonic anhydrase
MSLSDLLAQNRAWAAAQIERDPDYFARMTAGQSPRVLWIGCSDSRVPAEQVLGCGPGDLFVHRNVANLVAYNDINVAAVVQFATEFLGIQDVVVCGHYGCGGVRAACAREYPSGYIGDWLAFAGLAQRAVDVRLARAGRTVEGEDEYLGLVVEENVRLQLTHLANLSVMREQWSRTPGRPRLHGWVYDIATGLVKAVPSEESAG